MKKTLLFLSTSLFLINISIVDKEYDFVSDNSTNFMDEKEHEQKNKISPTGVWLPGDLEDEEFS